MSNLLRCLRVQIWVQVYCTEDRSVAEGYRQVMVTVTFAVRPPGSTPAPVCQIATWCLVATAAVGTEGP